MKELQATEAELRWLGVGATFLWKIVDAKG
jgi:hypothetical protein